MSLFQYQATCAFNPSTINWSASSSADSLAQLILQTFYANNWGSVSGLTVQVQNAYPDYATVYVSFQPDNCGTNWQGVADAWHSIIPTVTDPNGNRIFNSISEGANTVPYECSVDPAASVLTGIFGPKPTPTPKPSTIPTPAGGTVTNPVITSTAVNPATSIIDTDPNSPTFGMLCSTVAPFICTDQFSVNLTGNTPAPTTQSGITSFLSKESTTLGISTGVLLGLGLLAFAILNKD